MYTMTEGLAILAKFDWHQLGEIISTPDNIPMILLMILIPFFTWYALKQARANDRLIAQLEADPEMAKTHHRKRYPMEKKWEPTVLVWPHLLKVEFLAAICVMVFLIVWSVAFNAPLEEPANPNLTMNPSKAPWYFLGLQEMLVYFDPWIAGVVMPTVIIVGLMAIPYCDVNPLGNGYYTWSQRKYAITTFFFGFHVLWILMVLIGVFIRGPGWMWFWPGQTWDHHRMIYETNRNLNDILGLEGPVWAVLVGVVAIGVYTAVTGFVIHKLYMKYKGDLYARMNLLQYGTMQVLMIMMISLPVKIFLRLAMRVKYVMVTPWFNI